MDELRKQVDPTPPVVHATSQTRVLKPSKNSDMLGLLFAMNY